MVGDIKYFLGVELYIFFTYFALFIDDLHNFPF